MMIVYTIVTLIIGAVLGIVGVIIACRQNEMIKEKFTKLLDKE